MNLRQMRQWLIMTGTALLLPLASVASAAVEKVICVPWQGDVSKYHTALSGEPAQLKGVIKTTDTTAVYYKWVYGDGTESGVFTLSGKSKYNVDITHSFVLATGTPITAKLQVSDSSLFAIAKEDTYLLKIETPSQDARINIAIDRGLWWLYTNAYSNDSRYGAVDSYFKTYDASIVMGWWQASYVGTQASPTASAVHAFGINGHKAHGDPDQDPYVEAVIYGMNLLTRGYGYNNSSCPDLQALNIGPVNHGGTHTSDNPDGNHNGYGIQVYECSDHQPYQSGQIMDAIIASGYLPSDSTGRDFAPGTASSHIWTFGELLQDMADMYAWGQWDSGCVSATADNPGTCGSWWYNWNYSSPGDNSASQWGAIGLLPAQEAPWNVVVPQWVKDYNANWIEYSRCSSDSNYFHSYNAPCGCAGDSCQQTTTSALVQIVFDGKFDTADDRWKKAQRYIADTWKMFLQDGSSWGGSRTYGWYSFAKAMRLSRPNPTTQLVKSSNVTFDWYYGNTSNTACTNEASCEKGLAQRILEIQGGDGSWPTGNLTNTPLTTAWMIVTLKPALFASAPIACFDYNPKSTYSGDTITFDPGCSGHSETGKSIANLKVFEWDWNNDGTYDQSSTTPEKATRTFTCATPPCTFPVTLRVTDDANPALTATLKQDVVITNPPHPPVPIAKAGGPYIVSTCTNDSLTLDGSGSYSPDAGQYEAGCTTCPGNAITAWDWDLVAPLNFTTIDSTGTKPVLPYADYTARFTTSPGSYDIGLRVTDNSYNSFPGANPRTNLTGSSFGIVTQSNGCICTITAASKSGIVQLTWTGLTGNQTYDILRSTLGPNKGFVTIASNLTTPYQAYQDRTVVNGTTYYYRVVVKSQGSCMSKYVVAQPTAVAR